ncbi:hypothetical protein BUC_5193 [Burkholderia pseudomallei 576]|nr:hypothetical protein BUC_5193 [Burkholderia pseudomallei 576]
MHYSIPHSQSYQFRQNFNTEQTFPHAKLHKKQQTIIIHPTNKFIHTIKLPIINNISSTTPHLSQSLKHP